MSEIDARKAAIAARKVARQRGFDDPGSLSFAHGAKWAVEQLPSRDELAKAMFDAYADETGEPFESEIRGIRELYFEQADAVLALIREHVTKPG